MNTDMRQSTSALSLKCLGLYLGQAQHLAVKRPLQYPVAPHQMQPGAVSAVQHTCLCCATSQMVALLSVWPLFLAVEKGRRWQWGAFSCASPLSAGESTAKHPCC